MVRGLLDPGDHVVLPDDAYGGTHRLFDKVAPALGRRAHAGRAGRPRRRRAAIRPRPGWSGSRRRPTRCSASPTSRPWPTSPTRPARCSSVDNTFATPYLQRPLTLGADVVIHSTTKYAGGHSDVVGGAVVVRDLDLAEKVGYHQNAMGAVAGPFDAWLTLRGLKTLAVRMERHCDNAERVVEFLTADERVEQVFYPGLADHPGHEVAARADGPVRRDGLLPRQGRRGARAPGLRPGAGVHAGRVARRHRVADRAPRPDDPRQRRRHRPRGARPTWSGSASASRPSTTCSRTSTRPLAERGPARGLRRLRLDVHQGAARRPGDGRGRGGRRAPDHHRHRRPRRVRRVPGRARRGRPAGRGRRGAGLLERRRRPAGRRGRQRGAGHRRGRPPGRALQRRQGGHGPGGRPGRTTSTSPRTRPTSCCSPAAPTAATTSRSCARPRG